MEQKKRKNKSLKFHWQIQHILSSKLVVNSVTPKNHAHKEKILNKR